MKHRLVSLIIDKSDDMIALIKQTAEYISKTIEAIREGRNNPRNLKNIKNDIHFPQYKNSS